MSKEPTTFPCRVRTCNCSDLVMEEGIIRTLLIMNGAHVNTEPCTHWERGTATVMEKKK